MTIPQLEARVKARLGQPTLVEGVRVGDTAEVNGHPVLALGVTYGVALPKARLVTFTDGRPRLTGRRLPNDPAELDALFDLGLQRKYVFRYLSFVDRRKRIAWLRKLLDRARRAYYSGTGESFLSDYEYDFWLDLLARYAPEEARRVGAPVEDPQAKVALPAPAGSLNKTKTTEEVLKWLRSARDTTVTVTPKLDGVSVVLHYRDGRLALAATRGDGREGQDITRKVKLFRDPPPTRIPTKDEVVVRGEAILPTEDFQRLVEEEGLAYRNPRNAVAGVLNAKQLIEPVLSKIRLYSYALLEPKTGLPFADKRTQLKLLKRWGLTVPPSKTIKVKPDTNFEELYRELKPDGLAADGLVLDAHDPKLYEYETNSLNPKWARAWKPELKPIKTTVKDVEWNVSRHGRLKPRVRIAPVEIEGVTVTWISGKHAQYIKENKIGPGAVVTVIRSGDVIPEIVDVLKPAKKPKLPTRCPQCGTKVIWDSVDLVCPNPECPGRRERGLEHFLRTLEVEGAGPGTARTLLDAGCVTPEQLLEADESDLQKILGPKKGSALYHNLRKALKNVPAWKLALALGYWGSGYGPRKLKQALKTADPNDPKVRALKNFARKYGINVVWEEQGPLAGKKFVFTGYRDKELQRWLEEQGAEVTNSVTKDTTAVFARDPHGTSSKLRKARQLGVPIVPADEARDFVTKANRVR